MPFNTELQTALEGDYVNLFFAVEIAHPVKTVRLLDGAGVLTFGGHTWMGIDDDFGAIGGLDAITDQSDQDEAPELQLTIHPATGEVAPSLAIPEAQGAGVAVMIGAFDPATGLVVGDPEVLFYGEIDDIDLTVGRDTTSVTFTLVSHFNRFQAEDEAMSLSDSFHQTVWPGELGLEYMTDIELQMPWGANGKRPDILSISTGGVPR